MKALVTGGAGFIGSHIVDRLLGDGHGVTAIDNFSTGQRRFLEHALRHPAFTLIEGDLLDGACLTKAMAGVEIVFHFAANADVRRGIEAPRRDLEQNTLATFAVLEAMRKSEARELVFASTGSVYGEPTVFPTPETCPFPIQTSLYGASKVACEALIQAYCEAFQYTAHIFRFVSILGSRYSHGHVFDFYRGLLRNPQELHVLGDGKQRKSYLLVDDAIDAIWLARRCPAGNVNIYNLGSDSYCEVNDSIGWITGALKLTPRLFYSGGERGWVGDSPFIFLDTTKIQGLGWRPRCSIEQGVIATVDFLQKNHWLLDERK